MNAIARWMKKHDYSCADVAALLKMRSKSAKMNVWRHAHGANGMRDAMKQKYVDISDGEITLADLCKPVKNRKQAHA